MRFISAKEFNESVVFNLSDDDYVITNFNFLDSDATRLVSLLKPEDCADFVKLLNRINNQGIEEVLPYGYTYVRNGKKLGYSCLSSGERVFLFCFIADRYKIRLYVTNILRQLTHRSLELLFDVFGDSENIIYFGENYEELGYEEWQDECLSRK